jgi:phage recombination protein Bet
MNALVKAESTALSTMSEAELLTVLGSSLYPGAAPASIKLVLGYCKAAGLDPMQKPVHIVPMWDGKAGQMRDVVMPGVGLYRTQASRTGRFAGQTEPEFGPMVTEKLGGQEITYPEWARVTVKKQMDNGEVAEFTAKEFWIENYAVKGGKEKSVAPNAMWTKRPRGQIGKCAAAQALRLAFPEMGAQPTAEEMEGKTIQDDPGATFTIDQETLAEWMHKANTAGTDADALKVYNDGLAAMGTKDLNAAGAFKKAVLARRTAIKEASATDVQPKGEKAAPAGTSTAPDTNPPIEMTFAKVMDMLVKAKNRDALDVAADWIGEVNDPEQRKELSAKYDELVAAIQ